MSPATAFRSILALLIAFGPVGSTHAVERANPEGITVLAAASLSEVLEDTGREFTRRTGIPVRHVFAASSQLARQIEAGAAADLFISADENWMDRLRTRALIDDAPVDRIAGNRLVVIRPATDRLGTAFDPTRIESWTTTLRGGRLATGDPDFVPLGRYAREALTSLQVWSALEARLARAENARVATALVARGEASLGIVYATDAISESTVVVVHRLDSTLHSPIYYPAALTRSSRESARAYLNFLTSAAGQKFFAQKGFVTVR